MLALSHPLDMFDTMDMMTACPRYSHSARCGPEFTEDDSGYTLTLKTPGVAKENIELTETDGSLKVAVNSKTNKMVWRLQLPRDANVDSAQADHVDGVLKVTFPKKELLDLPHPGVECDRSGQNPILGKRFHLPGHDWDLCQAEFDKCGEREKALYKVILPPPKRVKLEVPVAAAADTTPSEKEEEEAKASRPYAFSLNAAGLKPSDLLLAIDDSLLVVRGETKATGARLREQHFRLPRDADAEKARAASVDGLLTITIPKRVIVPVTIPIRASKESTTFEKGMAAAAVVEKKAEANKADEEEDATMI